MATPLSATGRVTVPYTENGKTHKLRVYCSIANPTGPAPYLLDFRDATSGDWQVKVASLQAKLAATMAAGASFGNPLLEYRTGILWSLLDSFPSATYTFPSDAYNPAVQVTAVLRDTLNKKTRFEMMEGRYAAPFHSIGSVGAPTAWANLASALSSAGGDPDDPYMWIKSRGDNYLASASVVGITGTLNKKLRRARGLT